MRYIIIGAGISGLAIANILKAQNHQVIVFERENRPGGLIRCKEINGSLFHLTGGHVFNTKRKDVSDWFWQHFDKEKEFTKALRNSAVLMSDKSIVPYPIENHIYMFDEDIQYAFIHDLLMMSQSDQNDINNFEEFLIKRFGKTLYNLYFKSYNYKVWRRDLSQVPISWLEGKLPMPSIEEMIYNNMNHLEERAFVHSSFFYPIKGGSQFIAERLAKSIDIKYNKHIDSVDFKDRHWIVNGIDGDAIIFCGNIKQLPGLLNGRLGINYFVPDIEKLEFHGTTSVFCEIDRNNYSWIYLPDERYEAHRIICTGNFSPFNNNLATNFTGTIEFTDEMCFDDIQKNLEIMPFSPKYITHNYQKYTYPIQNKNTRDMINALKNKLKQYNLFLLGRFAEWEYYNMDVAIGAAIDLDKTLNQILADNGR